MRLLAGPFGHGFIVNIALPVPSNSLIPWATLGGNFSYSSLSVLVKLYSPDAVFSRLLTDI